MEKDSTGSQDQEEAPTAVGPEGLVPHLVENFEKHIQDQVTENAQISTVPIVGKEIETEGSNIFKKILEDFLKEQKEAQLKLAEMQSKFLESMAKTIEENQKVVSHKLNHHLQPIASVGQQGSKNAVTEAPSKANKQPEEFRGQSSGSQEAGDSHCPVHINLEDKEKYTPPHRREKVPTTPKVNQNGRFNGRPTLPHHFYANTNPVVHPNL